MRRAAKRILLVSLGLVCVALGAVGLFVPGLPTTVFLIVASWCFVRSSPRLDAWLLARPLLGAPLRRLRAGERLPLGARLVSLLALWAMVTYALVATAVGERVWLALVLLLAALVGTYFLTVWRPRSAMPPLPTGASAAGRRSGREGPGAAA